MKVLFWNTYNNANIDRYLTDILLEYKCDVVILAEYNGSRDILVGNMKCYGREFRELPNIGCRRIKVFSTKRKIEPKNQASKYILFLVDDKYIFGAVHMKSDMYGDASAERERTARIMMKDIHELESKYGEDNTVLIGDINDDPYSSCCLNVDAFHGLPHYMENNVRKFEELQSISYYNPMWNMYGDFEWPPGTYYRAGGVENSMWRMFDQVIISQRLKKYFKADSLKIITNTGKDTLFMDRSGIPNKNISDHFPIFFEIEEA